MIKTGGLGVSVCVWELGGNISYSDHLLPRKIFLSFQEIYLPYFFNLLKDNQDAIYLLPRRIIHPTCRLLTVSLVFS